MNDTEARDEVLQLVSGALPLLDEQVVARAVVSAVLPRTGRSTLAYLKEHSDWLTAGDPRLPRAVLRLLAELRAAGAAEAVVPGCSDCSRPRALTGRREDGSRICRPCAAARSAETCHRCGRLRPVAARQADATALCDTCYQRPTTPCSGCGQDRPAKAYTANGPVCKGCYSRSPRTCGDCHQERQIAIKASGSHPDLCAGCYNGPRRPCSRCGKIRTCRGVRTGTYVCLSCAPRPQAACARCGKVRDVKTRWPIGPVCSSCYGFIRRHPRPCPACGDRQPMIGATEDGSPRCGPLQRSRTPLRLPALRRTRRPRPARRVLPLPGRRRTAPPLRHRPPPRPADRRPRSQRAPRQRPPLAPAPRQLRHSPAPAPR